MKIKRLAIYGYGKWKDLTLDLSENEQFIYGENEAGKSTIFSFIQTMLFGFPTKRGASSNYEPKQGGSYGGRLWISDTKVGSFIIERHKDKKKGKATLFFSDGSEGDEAELKKILQPLNRKVFDLIYSFHPNDFSTNETISEADWQNLLLTVGLSGSQELLQRKQQWNSENQKLYKPNGRNPIINQKLENFSLLEQKIASKEQQEREFPQLLEQLKKSAQEINRLKKQGKESERKRKQLEKQLDYWFLNEEQRILENEMSKEPMILNTSQLDVLKQTYQELLFLKGEQERIKREEAEFVSSDNLSVSPKFLFFSERENECLQLLEGEYESLHLIEDQKKQSEIILEKEDKLNQSRHLAKRDFSFGSSKRPTPAQQERIEQLFQTQDELLLTERKWLDKVRWITNEKNRKEQELETIESMMSVQKKPKAKPSSFSKYVSFGLIGLSVLLFFLTFIVIKENLFFIRLFSLFLLALGIYLIITSKTKRDQGFDKIYWQKLLVEMDHFSEEEQKASLELEHVKLQQQQTEDAIENFRREFHLPEVRSLKDWQVQCHELETMDRLLEELAQFKLEEKRIQNELEKKKNQFSFLKHWLPVDTLSLKDCYTSLKEVMAEMTEINQSKGSESIYREKFVLPLQEVERKITELKRKQSQLLQSETLFELSDVKRILDQQEKIEKKKQRFYEISQQLHGIFPEGMYKEKQDIEKEYEEEVQKHKIWSKKIEFLQEERQRVLYIQKEIESDHSLLELYQERAVQQAHIQKLTDTWLENRFASLLTEDILQELISKGLPDLVKKASEFLSILTNGHFQTVDFSANQLVLLSDQQERFLLNELSIGTKDQLLLSLRLAFIVLHQSGCKAPLLIDDGWLTFDSTRKKNLLHLLVSIGKEIQIICFSSDQEMLTYFTNESENIIFLR